VYNGSFVCSSKGANFGTLEMGPQGVLDCTQSMEKVMVTNANVVSGARIEDPTGSIEWTNPFRIVNGTLQSITYNTVNNVTVNVVTA
jgi:hypothetical protein